MTKRITGAAQAAPVLAEPKKRLGGPSGKPGKHRHPRLPPIHAPEPLRKLIDRAIDHNATRRHGSGGYAGFSDWARHHLAIAAADELGIDPMDALKLLRD